MRFRQRLILPTFFALSFLLLSAVPSRATIQYTISLAHPEQHTFHIKMTIPDVKDSVTVQMPAWNALYEIRDFASHVSQVIAANESGPLSIEKLDKQTWRATGSGTITISYDTFWDEPGPFSSQINSEHAFINPAMILMYVPDRRRELILLTLLYPSSAWKLETFFTSFVDGIATVPAAMISAEAFDELTDMPLESGEHERSPLVGLSPSVFVTIHGRIEHADAFREKLTRICKYEVSLMGTAPYRRYGFIFHIGENVGGGGMEHANGTAIAARNEEGALTIAAHEFFHLWNVKRIRPASLEPVDYTKEQYSKSLWFAEGVTSTYERYTLLRAGLWSKAQFYGAWGKEISELEASPANKWQSAEQSSLDTWFEKYPIYNQADHSVSYYTKGAVIGLLLDLWIREQTNNTRSLDDMMRAMNEQFGKTGKPYHDREDLEAVCSQTAKTSCKQFFDDYVSGTKAFPYDEYFGFAGWKVRRVVYSSPQMGSQTEFQISEDDAASEKQKRIRAGILQGITEKAAVAAQ
ncbi:MAG: PDZ domain-containing protein [Candidatus Acidiferrum sp.]